MKPHLTCTTEPHIHRLAFPVDLAFQAGCPVLMIDGTVMAVVPSEPLAERIADLLVAHGLGDVPDDLTSTWAAPWPPPSGRPA